MTVRRTWLGVSLLACAALAAVASVRAADTTAPHRLVLTATYEKSSFVTDDVPPKGRSVGDQTFFSASLTRAGVPTGRLEDMDVAIDRRIQGLTRWITLLLPDGTIVAAGGGGNRGASGWKPEASDRFAVLGGTKAYEGARGEIVVRDLPDEKQQLTVDLLG
jgi:hypothetical protein